MANLTITVDEQTLKRARIRAIERGESVNAYLAEQLRHYAGTDQPKQDPWARFDEIADRLDTGSGPEGRTWTRDELYE